MTSIDNLEWALNRVLKSDSNQTGVLELDNPQEAKAIEQLVGEGWLKSDDEYLSDRVLTVEELFLRREAQVSKGANPLLFSNAQTIAQHIYTLLTDKKAGPIDIARAAYSLGEWGNYLPQMAKTIADVLIRGLDKHGRNVFPKGGFKASEIGGRFPVTESMRRFHDLYCFDAVPEQLNNACCSTTEDVLTVTDVIASALSRIGVSSIPAIKQNVENDKTGFEVRDALVLSLGLIGDPAVPTLEGFLKNPKLYVETHAVRALGLCKSASAIKTLASELEKLNGFGYDDIGQAFKRIGKNGIPSLLQLLSRSRDERVQYSVIEVLGMMGPTATSHLIRIFQQHPRFRQYVVMALGYTGDDKAVPFLENILFNGAHVTERYAVNGEEFSHVINYAVKSLAEIGSDEAFNAIGRLLRKGSNVSGTSYDYVFHELSHSGNPKAIPILKEQTKHTYAPRRDDAIYALQKLIDEMS